MNKDTLRSIINLSLELVPVLLFFIGSIWNIFVATALLMVGSTISIITYLLINKKLPLFTIALAVLALLFGSLTLIFHQDSIIKIKVTVLNLIIAATFFIAAFWRKNIISLFTPKFARKPSLFVVINNSWGVFFVLLAIINEIVWRNTSTQTWVYFKVFAIPAIVLIFGLLQTVALLLLIIYKRNQAHLRKNFKHIKHL